MIQYKIQSWWCSILVSAANFEGGLKIRQGISMKFLVLATDAQSGLVLGVRKKGDPWHAGVDPASVETQAGGYAYSYYLGLNLHCGELAVCSVACLEWYWRIMDHVSVQKGPLIRNYCRMKPILQKRLEIGVTVEESS